jgi:DNA polymerase-3 subunit gamma/tau
VSYVVLARKWRPKRFEDVVGQEHITTTLLNSIRSGRTAHAYLFVGPRGIGKTSTARIFAKALTCPEANDGEPCGECSACREIADGRSIDVIEIDGASNNSVEDVRVLRENVKIGPASLKFKVYIIDEVHMLSAAAFNAFLKTLEEPPAHVKFIFATTEAQKIPATVLSRCQRFDFRRLTSRQIFKRLKDIVDSEGIRVDERALFAVARASEGSMRDAQSILDQLVSFSEAEISVSDVHAMLGTVGFDVYRQVAIAFCEGDSFLILKTIDDLVERGKDLAQFLRELTLFFRNIFMVSFSGGEQLVDLPEEDISALKELGGRFKPSDLIRMVQEFSELEARFRQLPSARIALEMLLMRIAQVGAEVSIDSLISKLTSLEKRLKPGGGGSPPALDTGRQLALDPQGPAVKEKPRNTYRPSSDEPAEEAEPEEPAAEPESSPPPEEEEPQLNLFRRFLDKVQEHSMSTYSFLGRGRFCGIENGQMIIAFDAVNGYHKKHLEQKNIKMLLEETLKEVAGGQMKLKLVLEREDAPAVSQPKQVTPPTSLTEIEESKERRMEKALENPVVKKVIDLFNGKIVYVSG